MRAERKGRGKSSATSKAAVSGPVRVRMARYAGDDSLGATDVDELTRQVE